MDTNTERYKKPIIAHLNSQIKLSQDEIETAKQLIELYHFSQMNPNDLADQLKKVGFTFPDQGQYDKAIQQKMAQEKNLSYLNSLLNDIEHIHFESK